MAQVYLPSAKQQVSRGNVTVSLMPGGEIWIDRQPRECVDPELGEELFSDDAFTCVFDTDAEAFTAFRRIIEAGNPHGYALAIHRAQFHA